MMEEATRTTHLHCCTNRALFKKNVAKIVIILTLIRASHDPHQCGIVEEGLFNINFDHYEWTRVSSTNITREYHAN